VIFFNVVKSFLLQNSFSVFFFLEKEAIDFKSLLSLLPLAIFVFYYSILVS